MSETLRLNLGSGSLPLEGYRNIDRAYEGIDVQLPDHWQGELVAGDVYPLSDYADESVDEIRASHILEHFELRLTMDVLREWRRVLKPGGVLKAAVPDFWYISNGFKNPSIVSPEEASKLPMYLMGGQTDANDYHKAVFDEEGMRVMLEAAGFVDIDRWESDAPDCSSLPVSLNLMGRKPGEGACVESAPAFVLKETEPEPSRFADIVIPQGDVFAIMTAPRLGFTSFCMCAVNALSRLNINMAQHGGAFWDQGMTHAVESGLSTGAKYLLTLDYDTIFSPSDIQSLYGLMEENPDIDVLVPLQSRRENSFALFSIEDADGKPVTEMSSEDFDGDTLPITTGHFGLTMIRASVFERLPKPWYQTHPDPNGGYGDGRIDADIWFWHQLRSVNAKACLANRVVVGHLQLLVSWPGMNFSPVFQYIPDNYRHGKPLNAWR